MMKNVRTTSAALITRALSRYQNVYSVVLRASIGVVYLWFGVLKLVPGLSPADQLAGDAMRTMTFGVVPDDVSRLLLAVMEVSIGIGLITGIWLRATLATFFVHMIGVFSTLALVPRAAWVHPMVPSFDGQYILKNVVLVACCLHLAALEFGGGRAGDGVEDPREGDPVQVDLSGFAGSGDEDDERVEDDRPGPDLLVHKVR